MWLQMQRIDAQRRITRRPTITDARPRFIAHSLTKAAAVLAVVTAQ